MTLCYIALGSNLKKPRAQLNCAVQALRAHKAIQLTAMSHYYESDPMPGSPGKQPNYINAVVAIETELEPEALLDVLQHIEHNQGRERKERWGGRTLDLDILLYGNETIQTERLTIPHPGMHDRAFVMVPLNEIASEQRVSEGLDCSSLHQV